MRKLITFSLCFIGAAALLCSCGNSSRKAQEQQAAEQAAADSVAAAQLEKQVMEKIATLPAEPVFDIITSMGVIKVKLYSDTPRHRENFAKLALEKYYDGTLFHRVINGFMIQGGDPLSKDPANKAKFGTGCAALDGDYTVFGETVEGFDVIDAIAAVQTDARDCPLQDVKIITVKLDEEL